VVSTAVASSDSVGTVVTSAMGFIRGHTARCLRFKGTATITGGTCAYKHPTGHNLSYRGTSAADGSTRTGPPHRPSQY
jgi:hypothetical protein